jgi:hypothetical protein
MRVARFLSAVLLCACVVVARASAQTPVPFPRPGAPKPGQKPTQPPMQPVQPPAAVPEAGEPSEATLGMPVYPGSRFIASYDAGRGQRYYLFGTNTGFAEIVNYYRSVLRNRGELVYEEPPVHMFDVGRFREETMAFPPGISVKDYTWGGSAGYLVPKRGAPPVRYRTIIQIVPAPAGTATGR